MILLNRNICSIINGYLPEISYFVIDNKIFETIEEIDDYILDLIIRIYGAENEYVYRNDYDFPNEMLNLYKISIDEFLKGTIYKFKIKRYSKYKLKMIREIEIKIKGVNFYLE